MCQYTVYKGKILYIWFRKVPNIFNCTLVEPTDLAKTIGAGVLIVDCLFTTYECFNKQRQKVLGLF